MNKFADLKSGIKKVAVLCLALLVVIYILYKLYYSRGDILSLISPFIIALFFTYILNPAVEFLERRKIPRIAGILLIYAVLFGLLALAIFSFLPLLVSELRLLGEQLPGYVNRARDLAADIQIQYQRFDVPDSIKDALEQTLQQIQTQLGNFLKGLSTSLVNMAGHFFTVILVPILAFYFLRDTDKMKEWLMQYVPVHYRRKALDIAAEADKSLGNYLRGILIVSLAVGLLVFAGLLLFGVDFALILSILTGMTNIIPYFGPFIGAIPVVIITFMQNPALVWKVVLMLIVVQQIESQLISPYVLSKSLGLHPLLVIFVILAGGRFFGFWGLILAVPVTAVLAAIVSQVSKERNRRTQDSS